MRKKPKKPAYVREKMLQRRQTARPSTPVEVDGTQKRDCERGLKERRSDQGGSPEFAVLARVLLE